MTLPVTAALAAALAAILLLLAVDTVRHRFRARVPFGHGEDDKLTRSSRAHGNLAEHAPIVLIMMALLEMSRANHMVLMAIAGTFLLSRLLHILGLYMQGNGNGPPWPRVLGVLLTWLVIAILGAWTFMMLLGNIGH